MSRKYVHNLLIHGVGPVVRQLVEGEERFWMSQAGLEELLDFLAPRKDVSLSVDDGNQSDVSIVLPLLLKRQMTAMFFLSMGRLGQPGYLTCEQVHQLAEAGMGIGTHGMEHVSWRSLSPTDLVYEVEQSRDTLEHLVEQPVTDVAMPSGQYNRPILRLLRNMGFQHVYTVDGPWACSDSWLQPRYPLHQWDTPETIQVVLNESLAGPKNVIQMGKRWAKCARNK